MNYCLVYFSKAQPLLSERDLADILEKSRQNNSKADITGVILYVRGSIVQVLEGEKKAVEALYRRIEQDPRHTEVEKVLSRPITQRLFDKWSMGYETITDSQLEEIHSIVNLNDEEDTSVNQDNHIILRTINVFYNSNRYN